MAWIQFDLPLEFVFVLAVQKISGSLGIIMIGAFAMLADYVKPEDLARRILYCRLLFKVSSAVADFAGGYILDALGKEVFPTSYIIAAH